MVGGEIVDIMKKVWELAESRQLSELLDYKCNDFEAFCQPLQAANDEQIVTAICLLTGA